jgi:putative endonuclease
MYTVYVIVDSVGCRYVGQTGDMEKRLATHNAGKSKWTSRGKDWQIVYTEEYETRREALIREKWLKSGVGRDFLNKELDSSGS